jgi:hypothetical protein
LAIVNSAILAFVGATLLGWCVHCRDLVSLGFMLQVPGYLLAKIPLYLEFFTRRQQHWNRAERTP